MKNSDQQRPCEPDDEPNEREVQETSVEPMLHCPVCGTRLAALKCKLICERCGYYMSCADYY
jgi:ribosomal protein S27AE